MADYLQSLSPEDLVGRYWYISAHQDIPANKPSSDQDTANLFAYNLFTKSVGRKPAAIEVVSGLGTLTASNIAASIASDQAAAAAAAATFAATAVPPTQSADNMEMAATGIYTSTPGGTPTAFASKFAPVVSYAGSAPNALAAPSSDNGGLLFLVLGGAALLFYLGVFKHG